MQKNDRAQIGVGRGIEFRAEAGFVRCGRGGKNRRCHPNARGDDFRLSDYFDYIGGTSTGAIIAAGLSIGKSVKKMQDFYEEKGQAMFDKPFLLKRVKYFYNDGPLLNIRTTHVFQPDLE